MNNWNGTVSIQESILTLKKERDRERQKQTEREEKVKIHNKK